MKEINDDRGSLLVIENFDNNYNYQNKNFILKIDSSKNIELYKKSKLAKRFLSKDLPFNSKRLFFLFDIPINKSRGCHAHKYCSQFLVCLSGNILFKYNDGLEWKEISLDKGNTFLFKPKLWIDHIFFSKEAILGVHCSHKYIENEYVRDFNDFKKLK